MIDPVLAGAVHRQGKNKRQLSDGLSCDDKKFRLHHAELQRDADKHTTLTTVYACCPPLRNKLFRFLMTPPPTTSEEKYGCEHQFGS